MAEKQNYVIGSSVLETLTTGMYKDPIIIYREYIQNACDAIDEAVRDGLLEEQRSGIIHIQIDEESRKVTIDDNGAGVRADKFRDTLGNVANSEKSADTNKGFRGIGRLAGLAYCKRLIFTSSAAGERTVSRLICDAEQFSKMVQMKGYSATEVLEKTFLFETSGESKLDEHFFRVELESINHSDRVDDLLNADLVRRELSFVAPVPFDNRFYQRNNIKEFAKNHKYKIDEYDVTLNETRIFKGYRTNYHSNKLRQDNICDLMFQELRDKQGTTIAWLWYALTEFQGAISGKDRSLAGIRIRVGNIQIGDADILRALYPEERFCGYVIGEMYILPEAGLRPNGQRDSFNASERFSELKEAFRTVAKDIGKLCRDGSEQNTDVKLISKYEEAKAEHAKKISENLYLDDENRREKEKEIQKLEEEAEKGREKLERLKAIGTAEGASPIDRARGLMADSRLKRLEEERKKLKKEQQTTSRGTLVGKKTTPAISAQNNGRHWRTDNLSTLSKRERKLIAKVYDAVKLALQDDEQAAERVIAAIEAALK